MLRFRVFFPILYVLVVKFTFAVVQIPDWHGGQCQSGRWRALGGKLKVTQLSSTGYLGQFDFCAIARMGNAEDSHYCQVVESPSGSRKWYKYEHKTGCIASCVTLN